MDARSKVIAFLSKAVTRDVLQQQRNVVRPEVQRNMPVLKIVRNGAIVVIEYAVFNLDVAGLEVEECVQRMCLCLLARLRLVR